jgi:MFS family permease
MHKNIKLLTWFNFLTDFKLYSPIAIIYFSHVSGSFASGMGIFAIATISSALFEIPTGIWSDRMGRRKTLLFGASAAMVYSIFYAVGISFWILAVGAVFEGLSRSLYSGNNDALLHDSLTEVKQEHEYAEFLGRISAMFQVALAASAVLGGILATWSFPLIMWLSVLPQIGCVIVAYYVIEPQVVSAMSGNIFEHLREAFLKFKTNKKLRLLSISDVLGFGFGEAGFQFQAAFYNSIWPVWAIGIAKTASYLLASISYHVSGRSIKRFGSVEVVLADNIYNRIINIFSTGFPSILSPILMSSTSIFHGITDVSKNALFQKEFTNTQRATMSSLNSLAGSLFFGVVSLFLGFTADSLSPARALLFMQIFQIVNLFIYWKLFKHKNPQEEIG